MTITAQINGLPFRIDAPDGMDIYIGDGLLSVKRHESASLFGALVNQDPFSPQCLTIRQIVPGATIDALRNLD